MSLPKITLPIYDLKLVGLNNKKIQYTPFSVKGYKLMLIAIKSKNPSEMKNAIINLIKSCIVTPGIAIEDIPSFDLENLFLNIKSKSVGESIQISVTCSDDENVKVDHTIDIANVKIEKSGNHNNVIKVNDTVTIIMKYPSLSFFVSSNFSEDEDDLDDDFIFSICSSCIDKICVGDDLYLFSDYSAEEKLEFIDNLSTITINEFEKFFTTMPKLVYRGEVVNPNTNNVTTFELVGLSSFLA